MTIGNWEEIEELPEKLSRELFFVEDKFKAPLMGGHIVFHAFEIDDYGRSLIDAQINRGFLILKDTKEIWRYNGKYWDNDGEEIIRDIIQRVLGIRCCDRYKNEVVNWIKDCASLHTDRELLDSEIKYIGMENGVYNIETKQLEEHMPYHMITSIIPVLYNPDADCPLWKKFLSEVTHPEDINFIQEFIGYCFYHKIPWAIFVILLGHGRNGKTTLIKTITELIGKKNVEHLPLHKLAYDDFARVRLYRKWANLCADIDTHEIKKTGPLKQLTGGDPMFARELYQNGFNFVNIAKLLFACNELPLCTDKTFAMEERVAVIEFPNEFPRNDPNCDPFLYEKLITELPGIFNWAIIGLNGLLENNTFSEYKSIENVRQYLSDTKNAVYKFIEKHIIMDIGYEEVKNDVYQRFLQFAHDNKFSPIASNHFSSQFKKYAVYYFRENDKSFMLGEGQSRKKKGKTWKNIRLKESLDIQEELLSSNGDVNDVND